jgi:ferredoxin-NADP reductase
MGITAPTTDSRGSTQHNTFHPLRVRRVVHETPDASSFVLEVPPELSRTFSYEAGQFCNLRVRVDGRQHVRCYSMSSSPAVDDELQVTAKRVPGGVVSNWMIDTLSPDDVVEVSAPAGFFQLETDDVDVVAFAAGSGITPVFSLLKTALAATSRRFNLLYANRDRDAAIFASALDALSASHPDRLTVVHHFDADQGFVGPEAVRRFVAEGAAEAQFYICGPGPFMVIVEQTLLAGDVDPSRIHIERFTPTERVPEPTPPFASCTGAQVTIQLDGRTEAAEHRPGTTILQTARQMGLSPPYSCESGSCATCMAKLVEGAVSMHVNNALTPEEVEEGWVLTCQSVPTTPAVHVVYGYDEG